MVVGVYSQMFFHFVTLKKGENFLQSIYSLNKEVKDKVNCELLFGFLLFTGSFSLSSKE